MPKSESVSVGSASRVMPEQRVDHWGLPTESSEDGKIEIARRSRFPPVLNSDTTDEAEGPSDFREELLYGERLPEEVDHPTSRWK